MPKGVLIRFALYLAKWKFCFVIYRNVIGGRIFLFIARHDSYLLYVLFQALGRFWVFGLFIAAIEARDNSISVAFLFCFGCRNCCPNCGGRHAFPLNPS